MVGRGNKVSFLDSIKQWIERTFGDKILEFKALFLLAVIFLGYIFAFIIIANTLALKIYTSIIFAIVLFALYKRYSSNKEN